MTTSLSSKYISDFWNRPLVDVNKAEMDAALTTASIKIRNTLRELYLPSGVDSQAGKSPLRPSALGKPAIEIFAKRFHPHLYAGDEMESRMLHVIQTGFVWEAEFPVHALARGYKVIQDQPAIVWNNGLVVGHADYIIETPSGERRVVDCKAVNSRYGQDLTSHGITDKRGYLTQLGIYSEALNMPSAMMALLKNDASVYEILPEPHETDLAMARARRICEAWLRVERWEDVFLYLRPPPPKKEFSKGKWTGRWLPHYSMYNSPALELVYDLYQDADGKLVVADYIYPPEHIHLKPPLQ